MNLKPHLVPPHGHTFQDRDGTVHRGDSWPHLVRVVAQYRAIRKLAPGDPAKEITAAVCSAHPQLCHPGPGVIGSGDRDAYHVRVISWVTSIIQKMRHKVLRYCDVATAQDRAAVCKTCPFQESYQKDCVMCQRASNALQDQVRGDRPDVGAGLLGCAILNEDTAISVHLDEERLNNPNLPAHCWRKVK